MVPEQPASSATVSDTRQITPVYPLLLLQTLRDLDRPDDHIEDEVWAEVMPRRLGLSNVIESQIRRFEGEVRARTWQGASDVEDLIRLVIRRPDADNIFAEAGRRIARWAWNGRSAVVQRTVGALPGSLSKPAARRAVHRLFRRLVGDADVRVTTRPFGVSIAPSLSARADPGGAACALYGAAFADLIAQYMGHPYRYTHPECQSHGASRCTWTAEPDPTHAPGSTLPR